MYIIAYLFHAKSYLKTFTLHFTNRIDFKLYDTLRHVWRRSEMYQTQIVTKLQVQTEGGIKKMRVPSSVSQLEHVKVLSGLLSSNLIHSEKLNDSSRCHCQTKKK